MARGFQNSLRLHFLHLLFDVRKESERKKELITVHEYVFYGDEKEIVCFAYAYIQEHQSGFTIVV